MKLIVFLVFLFARFTLCDYGLLKNKFGPGRIDIKSVEKCRGHKKRNLVNLVIDPLKNDTTSELNEILNANYTLKEDAGPVQLKVQFWDAKTKRYGQQMTFKSENPCQCGICKNAFFELATFKTPFKACNIQKATRFIHVNITKLSNTWFGNNLMYGTAKINLYLFTKDGNLACIAGEVSIIKR